MKHNSDMIFLTWEDLVRLFTENKKRLIGATLICGLFILCAMLIREPRYQSTGTFQRATKSNQMQFDLKTFAKTLGLPETDANAIAVMRSHRLMRDVVKNAGLQISQKHSLFSRLLWNMGANFLTEMGSPPYVERNFAFNDVVYEGDFPTIFYLRFNGHGKFDVHDKKHGVVATGMVGQKIVWDDIQWTLQETPEDLPIDKFICFQIEPCIDAVEKLLARIEIKQSPIDNNLLRITYFTFNPEISSRVVNQTMYSYQNFLREENEEMVEAQLGYLEKRQRELAQKMDQTLKEHVAFLKRSIGEKGSSILLQETDEAVPFPHESEYVGKIMDIENELVRLENTSVVKEKEWIPLKRMDKAYVIDEKIRLCSTYLNELEANKNVSVDKLLTIEDLRPWIKEDQEKNGIENQAPRIIPQLRLFLTHLQKKKEIIEENEKICDDMKGGLKGLDLESSWQLYRDYTHQLDDIYAMVKQMLYVRQKITDPDFELSSLSTLLSDNVSREMIDKASTLSMKLQDQDNRSTKEQDRLREGLKTQKRCIAQHIDQIIELHKLRSKVAEDKIAAILEVRKDLLRSEKKLLENKLKEIRELMAELPEKWLSQKKLKLKQDLGKSMMEGMSQLTESKIINYQTFNVASKPLDLARSAKKPLPPKLFLYSILGACFGACLLYGFELGKGLFHGLPVTSQALKAEKQNVLGKLSLGCGDSINKLSESDFETLRACVHFLTEKKNHCLQLLLGSAPDFSEALASILSVQKKRTLIIHCEFQGPETSPGLLQYLLGDLEELPIVGKGYYDYIASGGQTRHGSELLASPSFSQLIERYRGYYDAIILLSRAAPKSVEAQNLFSVADRGILVLKNEKLEDVDFYLGNEKTAFAVLV